jgi:hypothetical protein
VDSDVIGQLLVRQSSKTELQRKQYVSSLQASGQQRIELGRESYRTKLFEFSKRIKLVILI